MEPQFPMPEPPDLDALDERAVQDDKFEMLRQESEDRKSALEQARRSVLMMKELHNATVEAFREELRQAVKTRLRAEMEVETAWATADRRVTLHEENTKDSRRRLHAQFCAVFTMLSKLVDVCTTPDPSGEWGPAEEPFQNAIIEARELLAVAAEYLD